MESKVKKSLIGLVATLVLAVPVQSMAAIYEVKAFENSTSGGVGALVLPFTVGDLFTVSVNPLDLWNAGSLPRWSNADGLTVSLNATGLADTNGDNPGVAAGTLIGQAFVSWTQDGLTAPFGTLVGKWGNSANFFAIGTNYAGTALDTNLNLFYFDSNNVDNSGSILVNVTPVPEPETYAMMLGGLALMGFAARRRRNNQA